MFICENGSLYDFLSGRAGDYNDSITQARKNESLKRYDPSCSQTRSFASSRWTAFCYVSP